MFYSKQDQPWDEFQGFIQMGLENLQTSKEDTQPLGSSTWLLISFHK